MKESQASRTAEMMALFRALESTRPAGARLFNDQLAVRFLRPWMRSGVRWSHCRPVRAGLCRFIDWRWPGARPSGVARTRFIDDDLRHALNEGAEQVVLLGAGYDCRGYRIEEMNRVSVFEVDCRDTQSFKRRRLKEIARPAPVQAVFVEVDFMRQALGDALTRSGFDRNRRTVFVWEGVTNYLDEGSVDSTLRFIGSCAEGSTVVFTYVHRGLLDGSAVFSLSPNVARMLDRSGEPWTFGFYPQELPSYLRARGIELLQDLGAIEYGALVMGATESQMKGYGFYRVAVATVAGERK